MLQGKCAQCGTSYSLSLFQRVDGRLLCWRCAKDAVEQAQARGASAEIASIIDPTICCRCEADNGSTEFPLIGGFPFCARCASGLRPGTFPPWLKLSLAGLLVLLGVALVHGARYFKAGKALVLGERLVAARQYEPAISQLKATLAIAPDCEKAVLLLAKADLLSGRYDEGHKTLIGHRGGQFKEGPLTSEVLQIHARIARGLEKAQEASKLYEAGNGIEAARAIHEAAALVPEARGLPDAIDIYEGAAAFHRKDYDGYLALAEKGWKNHSQSSDYAATLASALACKYAVTGDAAFGARAEEMLEKARQLAASSPEATQRIKEYEERTRYRLKTRQIIDPKEYDRRFHPEESEPAK